MKFNKRIMLLLDRLRILKETIEELINLKDITIEHSTESQLRDFEASIYSFQEITSGAGDNHNIDKNYAAEIVIRAGNFCTMVRAERILQSHTTMETISVLQACKDYIDKMIGVLKSEEERLIVKLELSFEKINKLKSENKELKKRLRQYEITGDSEMKNRDKAERMILNIFGSMRKQRKENMMSIYLFFINNPDDDFDTNAVRIKLKIKSNQT